MYCTPEIRRLANLLEAKIVRSNFYLPKKSEKNAKIVRHQVNNTFCNISSFIVHSNNNSVMLCIINYAHANFKIAVVKRNVACSQGRTYLYAKYANAY